MKPVRRSISQDPRAVKNKEGGLDNNNRIPNSSTFNSQSYQLDQELNSTNQTAEVKDLSNNSLKQEFATVPVELKIYSFKNRMGVGNESYEQPIPNEKEVQQDKVIELRKKENDKELQDKIIELKKKDEEIKILKMNFQNLERENSNLQINMSSSGSNAEEAGNLRKKLNEKFEELIRMSGHIEVLSKENDDQKQTIYRLNKEKGNELQTHIIEVERLKTSSKVAESTNQRLNEELTGINSKYRKMESDYKNVRH